MSEKFGSIMKKYIFLLTIVIIFVFYLVTGFYILPKVAKSKLENLASNEYNLSLSIGKIYLNPLNFKLEVQDILLKDTTNKLLELESIKTEFNPLALKDKLLSFEFLNIIKPNVYLIKKNEIFNLPIQKENNSSSKSEFDFEIKNFNIQNGKFSFLDHDLKNDNNITLTELNYKIQNINTQKNSIGIHTFNAKSNLLKNLHFKTSLNTDPITLNGNLELKNLNLKPVFGYFAKDFKATSVFADVKMPFSISLKNQKFNLQTDRANLFLKDINLSINEKSILAKNINFNDINLSTSSNSLSFDLEELELKDFEFDNLKFANLDITKSKVLLKNLKDINPILSIKEAKINEAIYDEKLNFALKSAELENLDFLLKPLDVNISKIDLKELKARENEQQILNIQNVNIKKADLKDKNLMLDFASIKNSSLWAKLLENNSLDILNIYKNDTNSSEKSDFMYHISSFELLNSNIFLADTKHKKQHNFLVNLRANEINPSDDFKVNLNLIANSSNLELNSTANLSKSFINSDYILSNLNLANYQDYISDFANLIIKNTNINSNGNFKINSDKIELKSNLLVKNLELENTKNQKLIKSKKIFLPQIKFNNENLEIKSIDIDEFNANLVIDEQNQTNFSNLLKDKNEKNKTNLEVNLNKLTLRNSLLNYENKKSKQRLNIDKIDANLTKQKNNISKLNLRAIIDKNTVFNANGDLNIKNIKEKTNLQISIKNLILNKLNPTIAPSLGKNIQDGTLSAALKYEIISSNLKGENLLDIQSLSFNKNETNTTSIPIEAFVAILSDSNNKMQISLPIDGNLNDPSFSYSGIIFKAFTNLVTQSVLSPFSIVGKLLNIDTKGLDSVDFEAGKSVIEVSELAKIKHYISILNQKPNLKLSINGTYDSKLDSNAMKTSLFSKELKQVSPKNDILELYEYKFGKKLEDKSRAKEEILKSYDINQTKLENLAKSRANSIKKELIDKGISPEKIEISDTKPISSKVWISSKITLK